MPADPKVAIIIGTSPDDPIREIAREVARRDKFYHWEVSRPTEALNLLQAWPLLGSTQTFILLASEAVEDASIEYWIARLCALRAGRSQILIYALEVEWSGKLALDYIGAGACDYLVRDNTNLRQLQLLEERIVCAIQQKSPYAIYDHLPPIKQATYAFIITPFGELSAYHDYNYGIVMALNRLGVKPRRADEVGDTMSQLEAVCGMIDQSGLIIANISPYGRSRNANVYFELGYAMKRKAEVPVILIQHIRRSEDKRVPSNINGIRVLNYTNSADLALKLYFGLQPLVAAGRIGDDT